MIRSIRNVPPFGGAWALALWAGVVFSATCVAADTPPDRPKGISIIRPNGSKLSVMNRKASSSTYLFKDKKGGKVLTNRPWKYQKSDGFEEVKVDYEPISIPKTYVSTTIQNLVQYYSRRYGVPVNLICALIKAESGFNPKAQSPAGACGLMQLMPATAVMMDVTDIFDPAQNIAGGVQYLAQMLRIFGGDKALALAAYNAGPNAVKRYGGIPPYPETQEYVPRVLEYERRFARMGYDRFREMPADPPKIAVASVPRDNPASRHAYVVHFHSGLSQPADAVVDKEPYYSIQISNRSFFIRKDLVKDIEAVN